MQSSSANRKKMAPAGKGGVEIADLLLRWDEDGKPKGIGNRSSVYVRLFRRRIV